MAIHYFHEQSKVGQIESLFFYHSTWPEFLEPLSMHEPSHHCIVPPENPPSAMKALRCLPFSLDSPVQHV
jgi:hypothetical protein